jgi:hypothetical protein
MTWDGLSTKDGHSTTANADGADNALTTGGAADNDTADALTGRSAAETANADGAANALTDEGVADNATAGGCVLQAAHPPPDIKFFQNVALRDWKWARLVSLSHTVSGDTESS